MSYELHITRAKEWSDSESRPITLKEWLAVVEGDPDLRPCDVHEIPILDGPSIKIDLGEGGVLWIGHPDAPQGIALWWSDGQIQMTNRLAEKRAVKKLKALAERLGARVVGDGGEEY